MIESTEDSDNLHEHLEKLNHFSWLLNKQQDEEAILSITLTVVPALVDALSCAIWFRDDDGHFFQKATNLIEQEGISSPSESFENFLQKAYERGSAATDVDEGDDSWLTELQHRQVAFIPLPSPERCLGVMTVHHVDGGSFTHDDILLLSSLGNQVSTALRNAELSASECQQVQVLENLIRLVGKAIADRGERHDEFVKSLLQVGEGIGDVDAACAVITTEEGDNPFTVLSGPLVKENVQQFTGIMSYIHEYFPTHSIPTNGVLSDIFPDTHGKLSEIFFAVEEVILGGKAAGVVALFSRKLFSEDRLAFLRTMAEQIGVGIDNRKESANLQRLVIEMSNLSYVSEVITSTFDAHKIFAVISKAASQAHRAPMVLCGWIEENGTISVMPDTTVGIPHDVVAQLSLTYNNAVIRKVLEERTAVTSRMMGNRALTAFPRLRRLHIKDWVCVPMMVKPRVRGIILLADIRVREFSEREIALLSTYANQAALAMENSLLYEQVDHQLQQMEQLYQMTRSISSLNLDDILQKLMQVTTTALKFPVAIIFLSEENTGIQQMVTSCGIDQTSLLSARIEPGEGIIGMVWQRGEAILSTNLIKDGRDPLLRDLARVEGLVSSITLPLQIRGQVLGTLTLISREACEFTKANLQLLEAMATEAAVAAQNARQFEQERTRANELLHIIGEVSGRVGTALELVNGLFEILMKSIQTPASIERMKLNVSSLHMMQQGISEEDPSNVDITEAVNRLARERASQNSDYGHHLDIRVIGAHLQLPTRYAAALIILINDWLQDAIERSGDSSSGLITVAFQQFGRENLVYIEDSVENSQASPNRDIINLVSKVLPGTVTETFEGGIHRVHYRFNRPA